MPKPEIRTGEDEQIKEFVEHLEKEDIVPFGAGHPNYFRSPVYRVMFDRIRTPRYNADVQALMNHDERDLRKKLKEIEHA